MPVLADFTFDPSPTFNIQRQYMWGMAFGWWNGTLLLASGRDSLYQEVPFGGFRVRVQIIDWFWTWDNRSIALQDLFENLYAMMPGDPTPISTGAFLVQYKWDSVINVPLLNLVPTNPDGYYWFQRFPAATAPYWHPMMDDLPATPYHS